MKKAMVLFLTMLLFLTSGCASIFSGGNSTLNIDTVPTNVKVTIVGLGTGEKLRQKTPCIVTLNKNTDYQIKLEYQGYESEEIIIRRSINGWFWGNLFLGGIIGMVIDGVSGNMWYHNIQVIDTELEKIRKTGILPEKVVVEYPLTLITDDNQSIVKYVPITFYKDKVL